MFHFIFFVQFRTFIFLVSSMSRGFTRHTLITQVVQKSPPFCNLKGFENRTLSFTMSRVNPIYKHKLCFCKVFYNIILNFSGLRWQAMSQKTRSPTTEQRDRRPKNSATRITSSHIKRTSVKITHPKIYNTVNYTVNVVINYTVLKT